MYPHIFAQVTALVEGNKSLLGEILEANNWQATGWKDRAVTKG
jgi:hypothetical protein